MLKKSFFSCCFLILLFISALQAQNQQQWVVFEGEKQLPGNGKHVVLISGDEEYRSEEMLTQFARILATRHGFKCTVLYAIHQEIGEIDPVVTDNIPGLPILENADLVVVFLRFRNLPDDQMNHFVRYLESGKPIFGIRTSTHAFNIPSDRIWAKYSFNHPTGEWEGGFGRRVLGETWISHHGEHKVEATRGIIAPDQEKHPIVQGCNDIFGPSDVYTVRLPLPDDARVLLLGAVLQGMNPTDPLLENEKNHPMMPILWTKTYQVDQGKSGQAVCSTIGSGIDFQSEGVRRLMINSCYWLLNMEDKIVADSSVDFIGKYEPLGFGFGQHRKNFTPADVQNGKTPY